MTVTIDSIPASTCGHRTINVTVNGTAQKTVGVHSSEIQDAKPVTFEELKEAFVIICRHQFQARRAAGRTAAQALADLINFTVYL